MNNEGVYALWGPYRADSRPGSGYHLARDCGLRSTRVRPYARFFPSNRRAPEKERVPSEGPIADSASCRPAIRLRSLSSPRLSRSKKESKPVNHPRPSLCLARHGQCPPSLDSRHNRSLLSVVNATFSHLRRTTSLDSLAQRVVTDRVVGRSIPAVTRQVQSRRSPESGRVVRGDNSRFTQFTGVE